MNRLFLMLFGALIFAISACAQAQDWRLVDANKMPNETYLILTIPQNDPTALAAIAAEIAADFDVPLAAEWPLNSIAVHCLVFDATGTTDIEGLIDAMRADDRIRTVQRVKGFSTSAVSYADPLFPLQWSLERMSATKAHTLSTGTGIRIGVVDSAIDRTHSDLTDRVAYTRDFVAASPAQSAEAHGTAVAGVIAASAGSVGMVGVAPEATLVGLRACWQDPGQSGRCNSFSLARALNFAILNDMDVINLSVGGPDDPLLRELIEAAVAKGMIVVAASGETSQTAFPASMPRVIAAGAGRNGRIPAPMDDIITTAPGERHRYVSGSSIATAHVSGVVALMLAQNQDLSGEQIANALSQAVSRKEGKSLVDACGALAAIGETQGVC